MERSPGHLRDGARVFTGIPHARSLTTNAISPGHVHGN
jgi:hypothetical protein